MRKCILLVLATCLMALVGCAVIDTEKPSSSGPTAYAPQADGRSAEQIRRENADLRTRLAKLEDDHSRWQAGVDRREVEKRDLKNQRETMEDERDSAKKAYEKATGKD